ncbi:MAG: DUF362 domain-containing protein [Desulfatiglandaceae bacterium]
MKENYPSMYRVHQQFDDTAIDDVAGSIRKAFRHITFKRSVMPGQRVAVAVGSRGIHGLPIIVNAVVSCLRERGLEPFIIPAMGSHGGAEAEGQSALLHDLGVTEATVKAPVVSTMDVASLGRLESGAEVFFSKDALSADHFVVINRVKPHTICHAEVESGLCKMLAVGCGKHEGASRMHRFGLAASIVPAAKLILRHAPALCGLAIVENSSEFTHTLKLALPEEFVDVDRDLLVLARSLLPKIPLDDLDILIVDEMGKDISGAGIDPNVIGFWRRESGPKRPNYRTLIVLDITPRSHGNAVGIGMVDLTTERVIEKVDLKASYTNAITTGLWSSVRLPIALENDRAVLNTALAKVADPRQVRMARIINTLKLETFWATQPLLGELGTHSGVTVDETPRHLAFNDQGRLLPLS